MSRDRVNRLYASFWRVSETLCKLPPPVCYVCVLRLQNIVLRLPPTFANPGHKFSRPREHSATSIAHCSAGHEQSRHLLSTEQLPHTKAPIPRQCRPCTCMAQWSYTRGFWLSCTRRPWQQDPRHESAIRCYPRGASSAS